jgi:hypothetical protein
MQMAAKPKNNWNDVQTAIATAAIVTTLGMWNLFATPAKAEEVEAAATEEKVIARPAAPLTDPPVGFPIDVHKMPYVKIMFTQAAPETTTNMVQQPQQEKKKKKKKNNNNNGGGNNGGAAAAPVTQTQSS